MDKRQSLIVVVMVVACAGCESGADGPAYDIDPRDAPVEMPPTVDFGRADAMLSESEIPVDAGPLDPLTPGQQAAINSVSQRERPRVKSVSEIQQTADKLIQTGQFGEAHACIRDALRERPDNPDLLYLMALAHFSEGNLNRAEPVVRRIVRLAPEHANARRLLSAVLTADGNCREALATIQPLFESGNVDAETYTLRAAARVRCGEPEGAVDDADAALRLEPSSTQALLVRCAAQLRLGEIVAAREDLQQARENGAPESQLGALQSALDKAATETAP